MGKVIGFLYRDRSFSVSLLITLLISAIVVSLLYPLEFLMGKGGFFEAGDAAIHVNGWLAFRADEWRFPLLETRLLNYPDGANIAFSDSIPILALVVKMVRGLVPEGFHYIGLWQGICFLLQGIAALAVMRAAGQKGLISVLAGVYLLETCPVLLWRNGHTALMTHALILFSMANYFACARHRVSPDRATDIQIVLLLVSFLVHPYFFAMNSVFLGAFLMAIYGAQEQPYAKITRKTGILIAGLMLILVCGGYWGQNSLAGGYDFFSMNLASPFCGGTLWHCGIDGTGGQHEGFAYLGAGGLLLAAAALAACRRELPALVKSHRTMFILLGLLVIYAVSNKVFWGDRMVLQYPLPFFLKPLTETFRVAGRFFWVPYYFILVLSLLGLLAVKKRWLIVTLLLFACVLQWIDLPLLRQKVSGAAGQAVTIDLARWQPVMAEIDGVILVPPHGCGEMTVDFMLRYQRIALHYGKYFNSAYLARTAVPCGEKMAFAESSLSERVMYVMPRKLRKNNLCVLPEALAEAILNTPSVFDHSAVVAIPGKPEQWWRDKGFHVFYTDVAGETGSVPDKHSKG